jgi:hypothetical protein
MTFVEPLLFSFSRQVKEGNQRQLRQRASAILNLMNVKMTHEELLIEDG